MDKFQEIYDLYDQYHSVNEIHGLLKVHTKSTICNALFRKYGKSRRKSKPFTVEEDKFIESMHKSKPAYVASLMDNRTELEVGHRMTKLGLYDWINPNMKHKTNSQAVIAAYMANSCFSYKEIRETTGVEPSKFMSFHRTLARYIPEFQRKRPLHLRGRKLRQAEYVYPLIRDVNPRVELPRTKSL